MASKKWQRINEAGEAVATWGESTTLAFPDDLPTQFEFDEPKFYVRECYPQYYKIVQELLAFEGMKFVTVTGTPGIGKSLFYAYFLLRYSFENPDMTIISASFQAKGSVSTMNKVVVWRGGAVVGKAENRASVIEALLLETEKEVAGRMKEEKEMGNEKAEKRLIYLYDGPPDTYPVGAQMVCFTSPNEAWFKLLDKSKSRPKIMMPLWDLEELRTAAEELDLTMRPSVRERIHAIASDGNSDKTHDDDAKVTYVVKQRYDIFGGVARECLSTDEFFVNKRQRKIETTIEKFQDISYVRRVLDRTLADSTTHHSICHYVPDTANPLDEESLAEPTLFVKRLLAECLSRLRAENRDEIIGWLQGVEAAASFRGSLFEMGVHEKLNSGHDFTARRLGEQTESVIFKCEATTPTKEGESFCYFDNGFSASILQDGPYHVPRAKNFVAIDSFYFPKKEPDATTLNGQDKLWLFQMTVAQKHPVDGAGLARTLEQLGLLEMVKSDAERVALIFVVPEEKAAKFGSQKIELETSKEDDSVTKLGRIGDKREKFLNGVGVSTIGQLQEFVKKETANTSPNTVFLAEKKCSLRTLRTILSDHDKKEKWSGLQSVFDKVPQFVWGLKRD